MCFSPKGDGVHVYFDVFMFCSTRGPRKLMFLKLRFFNGRPPNNAVGGLPSKTCVPMHILILEKAEKSQL